MKSKIATILAIVALAVTGVTAASAGTSSPTVTSVTVTAPIHYVNDPGGGPAPIGQYIARVYIYYNGYWHWLNCLYIVYPWGAFQDRCW